MFFRKITLIFASIATVVGFVLTLVVAMVESGEITPPEFFLVLIIYTVAPFFIIWGVYYVLYILYRLFRWAWKSTESDTTDP